MLWNIKVTVILIVVGAFGKGIGIIRNQRKNRDHPDYRTVEISQNTQKSPGTDLLSRRIQTNYYGGVTVAKV